MYLDILILFIIFVWAVFGYRKGFIKRLLTLIGMILAIFFSAPAAAIIEDVCANEFHFILAPGNFKGLLLAATAAAIYLLCLGIGHFLHATLVKGIRLAEKTNHILGCVLSIVEATAAIYFILCLTATYLDKVEHYVPASHDVLASSVAFSTAKNNNILPHYNFIQRQQAPDTLFKTPNTNDKKE